VTPDDFLVTRASPFAVAALDLHNAANDQLLWELTGDPMEGNYAVAQWVERAAEKNPDRSDVYRRFLDRISVPSRCLRLGR